MVAKEVEPALDRRVGAEHSYCMHDGYMLSDVSGMLNPMKSWTGFVSGYCSSDYVGEDYERVRSRIIFVGHKLGAEDWRAMAKKCCRFGQLSDPLVHSWSLSMRIPMSRKQMKEQGAKALKMFEQDQYLGCDPTRPP